MIIRVVFFLSFFNFLSLVFFVVVGIVIVMFGVGG